MSNIERVEQKTSMIGCGMDSNTLQSLKHLHCFVKDNVCPRLLSVVRFKQCK